MDAQTRSVELESALKQYKETKDGYERLLRRALMDPDPASKAQYLTTIQTENARLTTIVNGLVQMYAEGALETDGATMADLQNDVAQYKRQLVELQGQHETNVKFQKMLGTTQAQATTAKYYYLGYLIAVLLLLVSLLGLFFFVGGSSVADTVVNAMEAPSGDVASQATEAVSGAVGEATEAVSGATEAVSEAASNTVDAVKSGLGSITINIAGGMRKLFRR